MTSKAGLYTSTPGGEVLTPKPSITSAAARCSMGIPSPLAVCGSKVVLGAATAAGRLMELSVEQMEHAIAIAVTANVPTRQTRAGELSMWKGCAGPAAASSGVTAARLAQAGITGPTEAFEGRHGIFEQITGPFQIAPLGGEDGQPYAIERSTLKFFPAEGHAQVPIELALGLREQVAVDDIEQLNVESYWMTYSEIGSEPAKWDPQTRETADHSLPYLLAAALTDGTITPSTFNQARILDPALRPLMARITVRSTRDSSQKSRPDPALRRAESHVCLPGDLRTAGRDKT